MTQEQRLKQIYTADIEAEAVRRALTADGVFIFVINSATRGNLVGTARSGTLPKMEKIMPAILRGLATAMDARDYGAKWSAEKAEQTVLENLKDIEGSKRNMEFVDSHSP